MSRIHCIRCQREIGSRTTNSDIRLYKWNCQIEDSSQLQWSGCSVVELVSVHLLSLIQTQGVCKIVVHSSNIKGTPEGLLLWVFTPDLLYSSTLQAKTVQRAMKILYQRISRASDMLESHSMKMEEIRLPQDAIDILQRSLRASTRMLPSGASKIQEWDVGLLDR